MSYVEEIHPQRRRGDFVTVSVLRTSNGARNRGPTRAEVFHYWRCELCGWEVSAGGFFDPTPRMDKHAEIGHSPCERCGEILRNCNDGSARRHAFNRCPAKDESYRVVSVYQRDSVLDEAVAS